MKVWVASVATESGDDYLFAFKQRPTHLQIAENVWKLEGKTCELDWYIDTINVKAEEVTVE